METAHLARLIVGVLATCVLVLSHWQGAPAGALVVLAIVAVVVWPPSALPSIETLRATLFDPEQGRRILPLAIAVIALAIWFGADIWTWLRHEPDGKAANHVVVRNLFLGVVAVVGLVFAIWRTTLSSRQTRVQEQGHITDRFTRAVDQLGSGAQHVRLGGIYGLWRIGEESQRDYITVLEILSAFVRSPPRDEHKAAAENGGDEPSADDNAVGIPAQGPRPGEDTAGPEEKHIPAPEVRAILKLFAARTLEQKLWERDAEFIRLDLTKADLSELDLSGVDFCAADLAWADLRRADISRANLTGADLPNASLSGAHLILANLSDAYLFAADLSAAILGRANLSGADLWMANVSGAHLFAADLRGACLFAALLDGAELAGADLSRADLSGADLFGVENLTDAQVQSAYYWADKSPPRLPHGFDPPPARDPSERQE